MKAEELEEYRECKDYEKCRFYCCCKKLLVHITALEREVEVCKEANKVHQTGIRACMKEREQLQSDLARVRGCAKEYLEAEDCYRESLGEDECGQWYDEIKKRRMKLQQTIGEVKDGLQ